MTNETQDTPRPLTFREWRESLGFTQRDMAVVLEVHQKTVWRLEHPEERGGKPLLETALRVHVLSGGQVEWWSLLPESKVNEICGEEGRP
jgi:DNA-binding XRE family transcriptional regulator